MLEIRRIKTGRRVKTWIYRAYINDKPVRYKGMIISSDDKDSLIKKLKEYGVYK